MYQCVKDNPKLVCRCSLCQEERTKQEQDFAVRQVMGLAGRHGISYEQAALALIVDALQRLED